jgi:hypothetical protein
MRRAAFILPLAFIAGCGGPDEVDRAAAIAAAMAAYEKAVAEGTDLSRGPCIADPLPGLDDWVADVAHDPRREVDDDPANQCKSYRDGDADHFVELDPDGNLIRAE